MLWYIISLLRSLLLPVLLQLFLNVMEASSMYTSLICFCWMLWKYKCLSGLNLFLIPVLEILSSPPSQETLPCCTINLVARVI